MNGRENAYLLVGEVVKPHGVRGEVGIRVLTERPEIRFTPGSVLLLGDGRSAPEPVEVVQARPHKQGYLLRLSTVDDRDRAGQIRGWGLYIRADQAAEPADGESYYHHQLIGMKVVDKALGELGPVVAILETPAHDLLEVGRESGKNFYLPLVDEYVRVVDTQRGVIETGIPRDLMEL